MDLDVLHLIENMTLEEKASLFSGEGFWWTKAVERLRLPAVMVSDGPHGLRKQKKDENDHLGMKDSTISVCYPSGAAMASSFNRNLVTAVGKCLGKEARAEEIHTILGPAINIKRSPLCGRNFEYFSEDPYLTGELAAAYTNGVQSMNVGVCVKHYAANNQEFDRMRVNAVISERALREIYLSAFERTVKKASPWSIMCAYNRLNGEYCCENDWLLNQVLRQEWGFEGVVVTDWGAMNNRVKALKAGLHLEMPSSYGINDKKIVQAVQDGSLDESIFNQRVTELLNWINKGLDKEPVASRYDMEEHHRFARKTAAQCAVLLKNTENLLPLDKASKVAFIGSFADRPRYQGGGSSHINSYRVTGAVTAAKNLGNISFEPGWHDDGITADDELREKALKAAANAEVAVIFAGLPDSYESEGYDRLHLDLPECQNSLISDVAKIQRNTIVVLHNGSPVCMPWVDKVASILEMYLGGEAVGEATVDLLFGDVEPAGRLAETFPLKLEDTPSYLVYPGNGKESHYSEDVFIGYRWYDSRRMPVLFPFGHGLGYTSFTLEQLTLSSSSYNGTGTINAELVVMNVGKRTGSTVVQVYIAPVASTVPRPSHELKGFELITLEPGEIKTISFDFDARSFAFFDELIKDWRIESGEYLVQVGLSSRDLPLSASLEVEGTPTPFVFADITTVADVIAAGKDKRIKHILDKVRMAFGASFSDDGHASDEMVDSIISGLPLHSLISFADIGEKHSNMKELLTEKNGID